MTTIFWRRTVIGLALAVSSAALLTLAFPPYNLGLLIWVGFIPMLAAQYRVLPKTISSLASAVAIGGWLGVLLVPMFGGKSFFMVTLPLLVGALVLAVDKNKRAFHEHTGYRWFALEGVLGWVGLEMLRSFVPAFGTWVFVGYPLWSQPWLLQPLSVFGIYGLDLLIMLANYVLALAVFALFDRVTKPNPLGSPFPARKGGWGVRLSAWLAVLGVLLAGWIGLSLALYANAPSAGSTVRVAAIQPNLPRAAHRDTQTPPGQRLATLAAQTRAAAAQGAQIVVWPEMVLGFDPQVVYTQELKALATETRTYLVIGYVLDNEKGFRNEATVLSPAGQFLGVYGKSHPFIAAGEPGGISAGTYPVYDTPLGRLATMICFDASFTDVAHTLGGQGVQLIANPSLLGPPIAELPHTQIIFRAIENRTAIVMADVAYNSAIVDPYGRILELTITPQGALATLVANLPLGSSNTLYSKLGDWLGWLSLAGLVFFTVFMPVTMRRAQELSL